MSQNDTPPTRDAPTDPNVPGTTLACEADHPDEWVIYDRHSQDTAWIQGNAVDPTEYR